MVHDICPLISWNLIILLLYQFTCVPAVHFKNMSFLIPEKKKKKRNTKNSHLSRNWPTVASPSHAYCSQSFVFKKEVHWVKRFVRSKLIFFYILYGSVTNKRFNKIAQFLMVLNSFVRTSLYKSTKQLVILKRGWLIYTQVNTGTIPTFRYLLKGMNHRGLPPSVSEHGKSRPKPSL